MESSSESPAHRLAPALMAQASFFRREFPHFSLYEIEKMIGICYNAVSILEGELLDDAFK